MPLLRFQTTNVSVVVGDHRLIEADPGEQTLSVKEIKVHPQYNASDHTNDLCLLYLDGSVDLSSPYVSTISLPSPEEEYEPGTECVLAGWGRQWIGGHDVNTLQKVTVKVFSDLECQSYWGEDLFPESNLCTWTEDRGGCIGDYGGPLVCGEQPQLSGVLSGFMCGAHPDIFSQISFYVDWVRENINLATAQPTTTAATTTSGSSIPWSCVLLHMAASSLTVQIM